MRTTLNIPDEFYTRVKEQLSRQGFTTVNEYLLDILRHQFDAKEDIKIDNGHQFDAPHEHIKIPEVKLDEWKEKIVEKCQWPPSCKLNAVTKAKYVEFFNGEDVETTIWVCPVHAKASEELLKNYKYQIGGS